jgi:hypothetical protein
VITLNGQRVVPASNHGPAEMAVAPDSSECFATWDTSTPMAEEAVVKANGGFTLHSDENVKYGGSRRAPRRCAISPWNSSSQATELLKHAWRVNVRVTSLAGRSMLEISRTGSVLKGAAGGRAANISLNFGIKSPAGHHEVGSPCGWPAYCFAARCHALRGPRML